MRISRPTRCSPINSASRTRRFRAGGDSGDEVGLGVAGEGLAVSESGAAVFDEELLGVEDLLASREDLRRAPSDLWADMILEVGFFQETDG